MLLFWFDLFYLKLGPICKIPKTLPWQLSWQIVGMKHNRCEVIRVEDVKPLVQNVLRRTFNDEHLKQVV